jgi:LuxR family maltose regulon positive regulatory protein
LSDLLRERNNLEGAAEHLLTSKELGEQSALARWRFRWCITQARVQESQGELNRALVLLDEAKRHYVRGPVPDVRPITALKTRVWIRQGRLSEALGWAREQGLSPNDDLNFPHEFEHITLARILIAHFRNEGADTSIQHAIELLERLLKSAEEGNRIGSVIEILMLQALAFQAQNNKQHAHKSLERALRLAEPEGYVRIFVDEGLPIAQLLSEIIPRGIMTDYASELLAIIMEEKQEHRDRSDLHIVQPLIDPLSQREIDVLRLIAQGLSNQEISDRLFLALPTVKGYNHTIYNKLQVHRRTEAVARARELDLL